MTTWEDLYKNLPPGQTLAQHSHLSPIKATSTFRLSRVHHKILKMSFSKLYFHDWMAIEDESTNTFDALGSPYESSSLAIVPLIEIVKREIDAALTFSFAGPLELHLENRCCGKKGCAIRVFFECVIDQIVRFSENLRYVDI